MRASNYRLSRARRVVENAFCILTQKFRLFYSRIQLTPENADKVVLAACVLHNYLRNYVSVEDCVIENTDTPSQFSYVTTFRRSGGSAGEEAMSVREKYRHYFANVISLCIHGRSDNVRSLYIHLMFIVSDKM
jgi:hypothetical protein